MATTLGFHIILACLGIALPTTVLIAEFIGLRRGNDIALTLAHRWSQAMGVLVAVGAVTGTVLSFEMGLRQALSARGPAPEEAISSS
jgi:cytochrome bd ubiquinol oxidase subunit I